MQQILNILCPFSFLTKRCIIFLKMRKKWINNEILLESNI